MKFRTLLLASYQISLFLLPWRLRVKALNLIPLYQIHRTASIGFSLILVEKLEVGESCRIGNATVIKGLAYVQLLGHSTIGRGNWITGFPLCNSLHYSHQADRYPALFMGEHSAITNRHIIDCTATVRIGRFATFAGFASQILTHSINVVDGRQHSASVIIGDYGFVGSGCIVLPGGALPSYSVLGAGSVLARSFSDTYILYAGNPANPIKKLPEESKYFRRTVGFVY